jgi:hypothetical protein
MSISEENQKELSGISQAVANYFASIGQSQDYYENSSEKNLTDLQKLLDEKISTKKKERTTLVETFISDLEEQIEHKKSEVEMLRDQLVLYDLKIDQYDNIITNIDKEIIPLVAEINVGIASVKTAYDNRINAGCKSDLYWELVDSKTYTTSIRGSSGTYEVLTYECKKNPNVREDYNYYGAKYYRKPHNQDYGANIVTEFLGTISLGSTVLGVVGERPDTSQFMVGDKIIDNINDPIVFSSTNLPSIVGFGTTTLIGVTTSLGGSISSGSSIIAHTGIGTTTGIEIGDIISLPGVLPSNTTIVGFGTTTILLNNVWDSELNGVGNGGYISTEGQINSLIVSNVGIASTTNGIFSIGFLDDYPAIILDGVSLESANKSNFTLIRDSQISSTEYDYSNNPIDPVTIGILSNQSVGYGHSLLLVNNGDPIGPFQWHQVRNVVVNVKVGKKVVTTEYDPEPKCGADYARYYPGNNSWPLILTYDRDGQGNILDPPTPPPYASEGQIVIIGGETSRNGIGTTSTSLQNPAPGVCSALTTAISQAETNRNLIISRNVPKILKLISSSSALRELRDKLESQAFSILQGRVYADVEINKLKQNLAALTETDLSEFEPSSYYFNPDTGKTSTSELGK